MHKVMVCRRHRQRRRRRSILQHRVQVVARQGQVAVADPCDPTTAVNTTAATLLQLRLKMMKMMMMREQLLLLLLLLLLLVRGQVVRR